MRRWVHLVVETIDNQEFDQYTDRQLGDYVSDMLNSYGDEGSGYPRVVEVTVGPIGTVK